MCFRLMKKEFLEKWLFVFQVLLRLFELDTDTVRATRKNALAC